MEWLATLGRTLGFSLAAGVNLYATVAILGSAALAAFLLYRSSWTYLNR